MPCAAPRRCGARTRWAASACAAVRYGLPVGSRFVGTPRVGLRTSEYGRDYCAGYGIQVLKEGQVRLQLGVEAERRVSPVFGLGQGLGPAGGGADQRVLGQASVER